MSYRVRRLKFTIPWALASFAAIPGLDRARLEEAVRAHAGGVPVVNG